MLERMVLAGCVVLFLGIVTVALAFRFKGFAHTRQLLYIMFPLSQMVMVLFLFHYEIVYNLPSWLFLLSVVYGVLCGSIDFQIFKAFKKAEDKDLAIARTQLLEEQLHAQDEYTKRLAIDLEEAREIRKKACADLDRVDRLLVAHESQRASEGLLQAVNTLDGSRRRFCLNVAVDALVSLKVRACEERGIAFVCMLDVPNDVALSSVELCAIFSNLLDNAMSACEKVSDDKRFVSLKAQVISGFMTVRMENSCDEGSITKEKRTLISRQSKRLPEHGWGLSILKGLVERHEGMLETEVDGSVFRTSIMLQVDTV